MHNWSDVEVSTFPVNLETLDSETAKFIKENLCESTDENYDYPKHLSNPHVFVEELNNAPLVEFPVEVSGYFNFSY